MISVIRDLLSSKIAVAAIASVIVAACLKVGLELDAEAVAAVLAPLIAYILGQGVADLGKYS